MAVEYSIHSSAVEIAVFPSHSIFKNNLWNASLLKKINSYFQINENNKHLKNLYEGLTMTKASLGQVFKRHGLEAINPLNEKFDPNIHEALFQKV